MLFNSMTIYGPLNDLCTLTVDFLSKATPLNVSVYASYI